MLSIKSPNLPVLVKASNALKAHRPLGAWAQSAHLIEVKHIVFKYNISKLLIGIFVTYNNKNNNNSKFLYFTY